MFAVWLFGDKGSWSKFVMRKESFEITCELVASGIAD